VNQDDSGRDASAVSIEVLWTGLGGDAVPSSGAKCRGPRDGGGARRRICAL
jgi:hypothetical protein